MFSLVASLGKYALRIQNPYLFIDCSRGGQYTDYLVISHYEYDTD